MELERYICDRCGEAHELCTCGEQMDIEELESSERVPETGIIEYPVFKEESVEISEGIEISISEYRKNFYKLEDDL